MTVAGLLFFKKYSILNEVYASYVPLHIKWLLSMGAESCFGWALFADTQLWQIHYGVSLATEVAFYVRRAYKNGKT